MDRNLYKSQKKLADQGWQAMRKSLDRDLPEQRRRRPVALFWILGLLLPTSGVLAWLTLHPRKDTTAMERTYIASSPVPETPLQYRPSLRPENVLPSNSHIHTKSAVDSAPTVQTPAKTAINASDARYPLLAMPDFERPHLPSTAPLEFNSDTTPDASPVAFEEHSLAPGKPTDGLALHTDPAMDLPPGGVDAHPALQVAVAGAAADSISNYAADHSAALQSRDSLFWVSVEPVRTKSAKKWVVGAYAGILTDISNGTSGATAGLSTEWRPEEKWGLRSGLSYQYQILRGENRALLTVSTGTYVEATGDNKALDYNSLLGGPTAADISEPVYVPVSRLHRLEVPVQAFWQPFRKWRIWGGASIGTNLYAESGNRTFKNNLVLNVQSGRAAQNLNQQISSQLRTWDTRWITGIGFRPNQRVAIDLFYHHPLHLTSGSSPLSNMDSFLGEAISEKQSKPGATSILQCSATMFF